MKKIMFGLAAAVAVGALAAGIESSNTVGYRLGTANARER